MRKKEKAIRRILIILFISIIAMLANGCGMLDDEEFWDEEYDDSTDAMENASNNTNGISLDIDIEQYFDTSVIRPKQVTLKGDGSDKVTILVYVNGSNLESEEGEATEDISEMVAAGTSDNVTTLIQTMGTKKWDDKFNISSKHTQRFKIIKNGLELVDDSLSQLDCTKASTLSDFIKWGVENYPADRYILQFWNHGAGPVYGFGYDEWKDPEATMPLSQMKKALSDAGVYFDIIGMDCCIMSCLETGLGLYDFCDYMILSEEFESGLGWSYEGWMKALNKNSSIDSISLAKIAIDDNVDANEEELDGDSACMSLIDESMMKILYTAWVDFAYSNEDALLKNNYSQKVKRSKRARPGGDYWGYGDEGFFSNFDEDAQLSDYYITDIMAVAQNVESEESKALSAALNRTICYNRTTSDDSHLTGLAVTLPYGDREFYSSLKSVFTDCGIDSSYISWLQKFVTAEGSSSFYDYDSDWDDWEGWEEYEDDYDWGDWSFFDDDEYWDDEDFWGWDDECIGGYCPDAYYPDDYYYEDCENGYCEDYYPDYGYPDDYGYYGDEYYDDEYYEYYDDNYWCDDNGCYYE